MNKIQFFAALVLAGTVSVTHATGLDQGKASASVDVAARSGDVSAQPVPSKGAALPVSQWLILTVGLGLLGAAARRRLPA